jgi:hypothetical protein
MLYVLSTSRINAGNLRTDFPEDIAIREMTPSNARRFRCLPHSNDARISKCPALRPTDPLACKPAGSIFGNSLQPQTSLHTRTALATAGIWLFGRPGQPLYCDLARRLQDVSTYTISSASVEYSADNCRPSRTAITLGGELTTAIAAVLEVEARPQFLSFGRRHKIHASLLFGVTATDPATLLMVSLPLAMIALVACYVPAIRAARIDPIEALREE